MSKYPDRPSFRIAVFAVVRNAAGEILLLERAGTEYLPGYYDFPSGHVEYGESFTSALIRELAEEACVQATENDLKLLHINQNTLEHPYVNIIYEVLRWEGVPAIGEPHKCTDMRFFAADALPAKRTLAVRLMEEQGFAFDLSPKYIDKVGYKNIMGEPFRLV